jgi:hypothetical protein
MKGADVLYVLYTLYVHVHICIGIREGASVGIRREISHEYSYAVYSTINITRIGP